MDTSEGQQHQQWGTVTAPATRSGRGRPLVRRLVARFRRPRGALVVVVLVLSCAGLVGAASAATITEFTIPTANSGPHGITAGTDGALWFTERDAGKIGRITTAGVITQESSISVFYPAFPHAPVGIAADPDGSIWFADQAMGSIGSLQFGFITLQATPTAGSQPFGITIGPDGARWFTEFAASKIGRWPPFQPITEVPVSPNSAPLGITTGSDGALWFTELVGDKIGRITTGLLAKEFPLPAGSHPWGITAGPDGALWFTEGTNKIGRITTDGFGTVTHFPLAPTTCPFGITAGPDGALWFTEGCSNKIGRITRLGAISEFPIPTASSLPEGITTGPDGALWFTELDGNKIGKLVPDPVWSEVPGGGLTLSSPAAVVDPSSGILHLFVRGVDVVGSPPSSPIYMNTRTGGTWSGWSEVPGGGLTLSSPAAVVDPSSGILSLFVQGINNRIYMNTRTGGTWSGWSEVLGGGLTPSGPGALLYKNQPAVVIRGIDEKIYFTPVGSTPYTPLGGLTPNQPAGVVDSLGILRLFVQGTDNQIYLNSGGVIFSGWSNVAAPGQTPSGPAAVLDGSTMRLFVRGTDNRIYIATP